MINVKQWMDFPAEVRAQIAKDFNLLKTGRAGVANNIVISDGYMSDDLKKINLQNLQTLLDSSEENFDVIFDDYTSIIKNTLSVIKSVEEPVILEPVEAPIIVDINSIEEYNPNITISGDKETYFGTKIKPVTYTQNVKKETTKRK